MNITHIITGLNDGGAEAVLYRLCIHDKENHHTVISLMDAGKYGPLLEAAGVSVHCLSLPRGRLQPGALWRLWRLLRALKPDAVQTWMYHADLVGGIVARLAGVRAVVWGIHHTTLEPGKSSRATIWIAHLLARLSYFVPRRIAVCAQRAVTVHGALGYDTARMRVIANGYDLCQFTPDAAAGKALRAQWQIVAGTPLIGMVGRFDPQKDHANLLAALAHLQGQKVDFICVLVGAGLDADNAALVQQIEQAGLQALVRMVGRRSDIPAVMNALDVHVLSSSAEAFPNVLAEAMACGTPCVTTDVGDASVIVGDTGWVVPPSNAVALANGIESALSVQKDPGWDERKQAARLRIEQHFSIERMVAAYNAVWREALQ